MMPGQMSLTMNSVITLSRSIGISDSVSRHAGPSFLMNATGSKPTTSAISRNGLTGAGSGPPPSGS